MVRLGVNVDHVATVRQARRAPEPDPPAAALLAQRAGADSIIVHLREDRRHIQDRDVKLLKKKVKRLNLEMAVAKEILKIACEVRPDQATLVPEKRRELTTEGGLDVAGNLEKISKAVKRLKKKGIFVSLFIDPDLKQVIASAETGAQMVELHTGCYAEAKSKKKEDKELKRITMAAQKARKLSLEVSAGHGLTYQNVSRIVKIPEIEELNIGHNIIARAVMVGMKEAVREMLDLIKRRR
ncbi:pyridoxine 5'-phosphate synthase [bacterium]|nr:pyridoxine 5'-phosphate synthase [bacterium]MBU4561375.1 pyridoxine 5'-phosphate synthase [bacterium]MCG2676633.1 pyridoxine 5'-phosphate synthase [bacterium]MCG2677331.1 pyridoxine 5'-phosphate synthase [bacterium]